MLNFDHQGCQCNGLSVTLVPIDLNVGFHLIADLGTSMKQLLQMPEAYLHKAYCFGKLFCAYSLAN